MLDVLKKWCFVAATLDGIGNWQGAPFWTMVCALPCVVGAHFMRLAFPAFFYSLLIVLFCLIVGIVAGALRYQTPEQGLPSSQPIVLDELIGYVVAFIGVSLSVKLLVVGMLLVLGVRYALPRLLPDYFSAYPSMRNTVFAVIGDDLAAGLFTNFFFVFVFWLVR